MIIKSSYVINDDAGNLATVYRTGDRLTPSLLLPFVPGSMWLPLEATAPPGVHRQPTFLAGSGINDTGPDAHYEQGVTATNGWVRSSMDTPCWSSSCYQYPTLHLPMFDVDRPHSEGIPEDVDTVLYALFQADRHWIQSKTNWHVYMDAGPTNGARQVVPWGVYEDIMTWLGSNQLVDNGWVYYSKREGRATLRQPWPRKKFGFKGPSDTDLCCLWCGAVHPTMEALEEHEAGCG